MDLCFIPAIEKRGFISRSGNGKKQLSAVPSFRFCGNGSVEIGAVFREIKKLFLPRGIYFAMGGKYFWWHTRSSAKGDC